MTTNKKVAPAKATQENTAAVQNTSNSTTDKVTIVETYGPRLTKLHKADGTTLGYENAKSFKVHVEPITGIRHWAEFAKDELEGSPRMCQIHGQVTKDRPVTPGNVKGSVARRNSNFDDQPMHLMLIDVDGFEPGFADPVLQPELAIQEYVEQVLPASFQNRTFYWALSSSAGMPGKEHILKVHLWFWTSTPYTCAQLNAWAEPFGKQVDSAIYQRVQARYTATPIFEEGRNDPVPVRSGLFEGESDEVDLVIDAGMLARARESGAGDADQDMDLVDPSKKPGLIGLFHRVFDAEEVLLEILEGMFSQISERRYTWEGGGGLAEGAWVHKGGFHVGCSHGSWPIDGIANLWDLVRVLKFGDLDDVDTGDDFDKLDAESIPVGQRPSDLAMKAWARDLPEIKEAMAVKQRAKLSRFLG